MTAIADFAAVEDAHRETFQPLVDSYMTAYEALTADCLTAIDAYDTENYADDDAMVTQMRTDMTAEFATADAAGTEDTILDSAEYTAMHNAMVVLD